MTKTSGKFVVRLCLSVSCLAAAFYILSTKYELASVGTALLAIPTWAYVLIFCCMVANAIAATVRFSTIASRVGTRVSFWRALAAVNTGSLAGALFFQIAGQLIARGAIMRRGGASFANVVVITAYERISAAVISGVGATIGAYLIFGRVYLDPTSGGVNLIKLAVGLALAVVLAGAIGYWRVIAPYVLSSLNARTLRFCAVALTLSAIVQLPIMMAYVTATHFLSPATPIEKIIEASLVVMFAASVPVSFAGWGVRELSAVIALNAIGVDASHALAAAIAIGLWSMITAGVLSAISMSRAAIEQSDWKREATVAIPRDYTQGLIWLLPIITAVFVLFQIYIPVGSGLLNVNLADPLAILGGALFVLRAIRLGQLPAWRISFLNPALLGMTTVLLVSLVIGVSHFGWTTWALVNRVLGWFVLLGYGATGAIIVSEFGRRGLRVLLLTFVGASVAIAALEIVLVTCVRAGYDFALDTVDPMQIQGFSENHNFLAFQLLMAACATIAVVRHRTVRMVSLGVILAALYMTFSRSGWLSGLAVIAMGFALGIMRWRDFSQAAKVAALVILVPVLAGALSSYMPLSSGRDPTATVGAQGASSTTKFLQRVIPSDSDNEERLRTMRGGIRLFESDPIWGAGLGAYRHENHIGGSGIPQLIHSTGLWLLAETGLVGFAVFLIPVLGIFFVELREARRDPIAALIVLALVGMGAMSMPADMLYQRTFWLLFGAALAVRTAAEMRSTPVNNVAALTVSLLRKPQPLSSSR